MGSRDRLIPSVGVDHANEEKNKKRYDENQLSGREGHPYGVFLGCC